MVITDNLWQQIRRSSNENDIFRFHWIKRWIVLCSAGKRGCVACKRELANNINEFLNPIREKRKYYEENPEIVDKILKDGTEKARKTAKETMRKVKKAMMLDYFE